MSHTEIKGDFQLITKYVNTYITDKYIVSGTKVEKLSYSVPIRCDFKREHTVKRGTKQEEGKREDNLNRARKSVRRIIWANKTPHTKFLTLTCADTCLEKKVFMRRFTSFCQAMKRQGYPLSYLYVLERQKERGEKEGNEGTIHAHLVVFNDEYIPFEIINKCWKWGGTDIHILNELRYDNGERVRDVGCYVSKYITKEANLEWGSRCYNCSVGLARAVEIPVKAYGDTDIGLVYDNSIELNELTESIEKETIYTYSNTQLVLYEINGTTIYQMIDYKQGHLKCA